MDDEPGDITVPRTTDPDTVFNALLLTDAGMKAGQLEQGPSDFLRIEEAVAEWTDDERAAAYEWAIREHFVASDNDNVKRVPKPPHVAAL